MSHIDRTKQGAAVLLAISKILNDNNMSLGHEDEHGSFILYDQWDATYEKWLLEADVISSEKHQ